MSNISYHNYHSYDYTFGYIIYLNPINPKFIRNVIPAWRWKAIILMIIILTFLFLLLVFIWDYLRALNLVRQELDRIFMGDFILIREQNLLFLFDIRRLSWISLVFGVDLHQPERNHFWFIIILYYFVSFHWYKGDYIWRRNCGLKNWPKNTQHKLCRTVLQIFLRRLCFMHIVWGNAMSMFYTAWSWVFFGQYLDL